jgi:signal transduction histidine kinase
MSLNSRASRTTPTREDNSTSARSVSASLLFVPSLFRLYLATTVGIVFSIALAFVGYLILFAPNPEWVESDMMLFTRALDSLADIDDVENARINAKKIAQLNFDLSPVKPEPSEMHYAIFRNGHLFIDSGNTPTNLFASMTLTPPANAIRKDDWYLHGFKRMNSKTVSLLAINKQYVHRLIRTAVLSGLPFALAVYAFVAALVAFVGSFFALRPINNLAKKIQALDANRFEQLQIKPKFQELMPVVVALNERTLSLKTQIESERVFFSSAAHELRTPLAVIHAQAHSVSKAKNDQDRLERILALESGVDRAARALGRMLQLARLDSTPDPTPTTRINLVEVAAECVAFHAPRAMANQQAISLEADKPIWVLSDRRDIVTLFDNLIENAINYSGGGANIVVAVGVKFDGQSFLSVEDNGPGFSADDHASAFERFRRGSQAQANEGSGLGLAIVKAAALRWRGQATVSVPLLTNGLRVTITFPKSTDQSLEG